MRALVAPFLVAMVIAPAVSRADEPTAGAAATAEATATANPFRGSTITYRNSASALTFDKAGEPWYNPTWVMSLELAPRFALNKIFSVGASIDFSREITEDDSSTLSGETWVGNLSLAFNASKFVTIPGAGIDVSASVQALFPTSLAAQYQTMLFAVAPGLRLSRNFDVLSGISLGYGLRVTKNFHEYTTSETETPQIPGCFNGAGGCESYLNTGVRNSSWRLSNSFDLSVAFTEWLSLDLSFAILTSYLYDAVEDGDVTLTPQEPQDIRTALNYEVGVTFTPLSYFSVGLGATTFNPQLKPDSTNYEPFFNRYTALYLDLRLDVADLVATALR